MHKNVNSGGKKIEFIQVLGAAWCWRLHIQVLEYTRTPLPNAWCQPPTEEDAYLDVLGWGGAPTGPTTRQTK